jgi:hypothetical protein
VGLLSDAGSRAPDCGSGDRVWTGRPLGSEGFTREVERLTGRTLRRQKPGPKGARKHKNRPKER